MDAAVERRLWPKRATSLLLVLIIFNAICATLASAANARPGETEEQRKRREALEEKVVLLSPHGEGGPESSVQPTRPSDQQPPPAGQQQQQATTAAPTTTAQSTPETDADEEGDDDDDVEQMDYEGFIMAARKLLNEAEHGQMDAQAGMERLLELAEEMGVEIKHEDLGLVESELHEVLKLREEIAHEAADMQNTQSDGTMPLDGYDRREDDLEAEDSETEPLSPDELRAKELYERAESMLLKSRQAGQKIITSQAYRLLDEATGLGNRKAKALIAYAYLFGDHMPWNPEIARQLFQELANDGVPEAQMALSFMYSTSIGLPSGESADQAIALIHLNFAALGGDSLAQMALGYRYWAGVNVASDCEKALTWYRTVARKVASEVRAGSSVSVQRTRLPDELEVTSASSAGAQTMMDDNLLQYYRFLADKGDIQAQVGLGQLYLLGGRGVEQNHQQAFHYFHEAAEQGSANAFGYLGKMYLDGTTATPQNNQTAYNFFKKAADKSNAVGLSGLGVMHLYGKGVEQNYDKAFRFFTQAAEQGWVDGQLNLGHMYFNGLGVPRDYKYAIKYFQLASQGGHVLAYYNLAQIHAAGTGTTRNCHTAVELYKNVAERGKWSTRLTEAYSQFRAGQYDQAALKYLFLAELGFEIAQTNFAYMLDQQLVHMFNNSEVHERALLYWTRSANQGYGLSRVKMGDYHYYGWGTPVDYESAATHYKTATEQTQNAQAMFNLGYMHEQGLGVKPDIHLAKRFYDMAAETSSDAEVPVNLALLKLAVLFFWHYAKELPLVKAVFVHLHQYFGDDWDMFAIGALTGLLTILIFMRLRQR